MYQRSVLADVMQQESSPCKSEALTDGSHLVSQASTDMLGDFNTDDKLLEEAVNGRDGNKRKDREVLRQVDGPRREGRTGAVTQCLGHEEGDSVKADMAGVHRHVEGHNNVTTLHPSAPRQMHTRDTLLPPQVHTASNREGQGTRALEEWTHPEMTVMPALHSHQPNAPVSQDMKVGTVEPSHHSGTMSRCDIQGKGSHVPEHEVAGVISAAASYTHCATECDVHAPPLVTEAAEHGAVLSHRDILTESREDQAGEEDAPIRTLLTGIQAECCYPLRDNALAGVVGRHWMNEAGSGECMAEPDHPCLLSNAGTDWHNVTVVGCQVSGACAGGGQPVACGCPESGELKEDGLSCQTSDTRPLTEAELTPGGVEQECPVCTELFDLDTHRQALLNCNHSFCASCVRSIMERATARSSGHMRCPVCRQTTPMPHWEIRQLQEEMSFLNGAVCVRDARLGEVPTRPVPAARLCDWLEQGFQQRMMTTRRCGYLPCLRYPSWLVNALARCDQRCSCCYLCAILLLYSLQLLCLSLIFTPVVILILLFTLLGKE